MLRLRRADDSVKPKTLPSKTPAAHTDLTAKQAAAMLAEATGVTSLGHPTDNTTSCSEQAAGKEPNPNDCLQLITTDTVSIYEYASPRIAAHRVEFMATKDWRQAGRFALAWNARDQKDAPRAENDSEAWSGSTSTTRPASTSTSTAP